MKLRAVFVLLLLSTATLHAQYDGCSGALQALNRVKESIRPDIDWRSAPAQTKLRQISVALERGTNICKDRPELWYYRMVVSAKLGAARDSKYAQSKLDEFSYTPVGDPFLPPASGADEPKPDPLQPPHKWALVIGIDTFADKRISALRFASKDAQDFSSMLADPSVAGIRKDHVKQLINDDATLANFKKALGDLRLKVKPNDTVVIYFASHGSPRTIDPNGVSYILMHDSDLSDGASLYATSLQMVDLVQMLNRDFRNANLIMVLDTCFSGDALQEFAPAEARASRGVEVDWSSGAEVKDEVARSYSPTLEYLNLYKGRAIITASRASEPSWESPKIGHGYFTYYLIKVATESGRGAPLPQIFDKVRSAVSANVLNDQHAKQTPVYNFSPGGESIGWGGKDSE